MSTPTDKYRYCNHHHELDDEHELVDFGTGEFVANKAAIPLLKALNEIGLRTRSHHVEENGHCFVTILLEGVRLEIQQVNESCPERTQYNGKTEVVIKWNSK